VVTIRFPSQDPYRCGRLPHSCRILHDRVGIENRLSAVPSAESNPKRIPAKAQGQRSKEPVPAVVADIRINSSVETMLVTAAGRAAGVNGMFCNLLLPT
jgi:hypothetical protein